MYYQIPENIYKRDGPFEEFKQDASIVSIELHSGLVFNGVLILYPNYIVSMKDKKTLPFEINDIKRVFQTKEDLKTRTNSDWIGFPHPWDGKTR